MPAIVDFGEVGVGFAGRRNLILSNRGLAPLIISEISVNDELAPEVRLDAVPAGIAGGGMYSVPLVFSPQRPGNREGTIRIRSNSAGAPLIEVRVVGEAVEPQLEVSPSEIDFGRVIVGDIRTATVTVTNTRGEELIVRAVTGDVDTSPEFTAGIGGSRRLAPGASFTLSIAYAPLDTTLDAGRMIIADSTTLPARVSIGVRGEGALSELGIEPSMIEISGLFPGETKRRSFELRNLGPNEQTITRIVLAGTATVSELSVVTSTSIVTPFALRPGESRRVVVEYAPRDSGVDSAVVAIASTALEGDAFVFITGRAAMLPFVALSASPDALSFGSVELSTVRRKKLRLANRGTVDARVSSVQVTPEIAAYRLIDPPDGALLEPGEDRTMFVELSPSELGPLEASLVITLEAVLDPVVVPLSGAGVDEPVASIDVELEPFGPIPLGMEAWRNVLIQSTGSATVTVTQVRLESESVFNVLAPPSPVSLAPGEELAVPIRFLDFGGAEALYATSVLIESEDPTYAQPDVLVAQAGSVLFDDAPGFMAELYWQGGANVDLHLVRAGGVLFDRPNDATFCSPNPAWGAPFERLDDPLYLADFLQPPGGERVILSQVTPGDYAVIVEHRDDGGFGPAEIALAIYARGQQVWSGTRVIAAGQRFDAGTFSFDGATPSFVPAQLPLGRSLRDDCY